MSRVTYRNKSENIAWPQVLAKLVDGSGLHRAAFVDRGLEARPGSRYLNSLWSQCRSERRERISRISPLRSRDVSIVGTGHVDEFGAP